MLDSTQCGGRENCRDENKCITHNLWADLNQHIFSFLEAVTLAQLVADQKPGQVVQVHDMREARQQRERATIAVQ
jgi:Rrf2 family iron-sulfur cluster assembly transcriptional regulator